jgi:predicted enzyme related to lactoylglutathione lyase
MENVVSQVYMVVLMQKDLEVAVKFYEKLGLKLNFNLENKWAEFNLNGVMVGLCPSPEVEKGRYTGIVFKTDDVQKMYEALKADAVEFVAEPSIATHGVMASFLDPSGNRLDLYQPTHEKVREVLEKEGKFCGPDAGCKKADGDACCKK